MPTSLEIVPISELRAGASARLHEARVDPACRAWLRALGLSDSSVMHVRKQGDPCIIEVRSTRIGLSSSVAENLFVRGLTGDRP
jgi:Fe2+ transport system protein FeoA